MYPMPARRRHLAAAGHRDLRSLAPAADQHAGAALLRLRRHLGAPCAGAREQPRPREMGPLARHRARDPVHHLPGLRIRPRRRSASPATSTARTSSWRPASTASTSSSARSSCGLPAADLPRAISPPRSTSASRPPIWYWHFVDVVWLFLFAAVYIWGVPERPAPAAGAPAPHIRECRHDAADDRAADLRARPGVAILVALGVWQVQRLDWKTAILARIDERLAAAAGAAADGARARSATSTGGWPPAAASGAGELHVYTSAPPRGVGYRVIVPVRSSTAGRASCSTAASCRSRKRTRPGRLGPIAVEGNAALAARDRRLHQRARPRARTSGSPATCRPMAAALGTEPVLLVAAASDDPAAPMPLPVDARTSPTTISAMRSPGSAWPRSGRG